MRILFGLAVLLAACAPSEPNAPRSAVTDSADAHTSSAPTDAPRSVPDTVSITTDDRALADRPTSPLRVDGACPFEGCVYGTWTTSAETTVYAVAADTTSATFTVPAGTALEADRGFVLLTRLGEAVVLRPTDLFLAADETRPLAEGDTLLILDYEGEGSYRVWADGQVGFSGAGSDVGPPGEGPALRRITEPASQWWAHVTAPDGREGWLWMDRTPDVRGADALAG